MMSPRRVVSTHSLDPSRNHSAECTTLTRVERCGRVKRNWCTSRPREVCHHTTIGVATAIDGVDILLMHRCSPTVSSPLAPSFSPRRHQADACHAYQIVKKNGIPAENIITFMYDDVASDPANPFPGKLFNAPTAAGTPGKDVYATERYGRWNRDEFMPRRSLSVSSHYAPLVHRWCTICVDLTLAVFVPFRFVGLSLSL
jgi:hypothetical protein